MDPTDYAALAQTSYEAALFYVENALKRKHVPYALSVRCKNALSETKTEMETSGMKDDIYTASIRKWFNISLYEEASSNSSRLSKANAVLEEAYKMRSLHEAAFLANALDEPTPDFDASRRSFANLVSIYNREIPTLQSEVES